MVPQPYAERRRVVRRPSATQLGAFVAAALLVCFSDGRAEEEASTGSLDELRREIETVLAEGHTPGVSVALVRRSESSWAAGLGSADVASGRPATAETLFRIGSVSKQFVSLAILLLVERGKLSLEDSVHTLVPDVHFENRWEDTHPIRVVHLLEHTTGWDDIHLREYAKDGSRLALREALEYGSGSRVSRWRPGTRMAYCNSGPAVAAYIVEKLTGQRFEDFVAHSLFEPIGMTSATYFQPDPPLALATLYRDGTTTSSPYWHVLYRPSGAVNASARDMAAYLQFMLDRGRSEVGRIVAVSGIDRMEAPRTTWAARQGLKTGYGLTTAALIRDGFVWHGHSGDLMGGLSELWYLPQHGVGYFTSINSDNGGDSFRIGQAVRRYLTRGLPPPAVPPPADIPTSVADYRGWYEPVSPGMQLSHFLERLSGLSHLALDDGRLIFRSAEGNRQYLPVNDGTQFRRIYESGPQDPVPTLMLVASDEGRFVQIGTNTETLRHIPAWVVAIELTLLTYVLLSVLAVLVYALFWIVGGLRFKSRPSRESILQVWPLLSVLSLMAAALLLRLVSEDPIGRLGQPTPWSVGLCFSTLAFAGSALAAAVVIWRTPTHSVAAGVRRDSQSP